MRRKLTATLVAATALGLLSVPSPAQARCDQGGPTAGHTDQAVLPGTGSHVYSSPGDPTANTSGYIGVHGGTGYIEAGGSRDGVPQGSIQGGSNDGALNAKISGDGAGPHVCVNDTNVI